MEMCIRDRYEPMGIPIKCVSHSTGEFIKYLSNTLLAALISYSNEMAEAAEAFGGIDVAEAFRILHMDKRWNNCSMTSYVYPGCGYGGYCLPKDTCAFYTQAEAKGFDAQILGQVIRTNTERPRQIAEQIGRYLNNCIQQQENEENDCPAGERRSPGTIGILGLSFKPESDDVRDTPAVKIIQELKKLGYQDIIAYDPIAMNVFQQKYPDIAIGYAESLAKAYDESDILAIVTAWEEFRIVPALGKKKVIDCRYML